MGAVQTGVQFGGIFYEGNKSLLCDTRCPTFSLSRCLRSSVKFPQSVMVWGAMSSAGVGPLCFLRSKVNRAVYQEVLEHLMLPAADQLYGDADFIFKQDLAPAHSAKATSTWFKDHGIPVLNWPANSPDLIHCEEEDAICQTQQCRRAEGHYQSNLGSHNT